MEQMRKRLKDALASSGLSFEEAEERAGLEKGSISRYISGEERPETQAIKSLAKVLSVSENYILFGARSMGEMKAMFPNEVTPDHTPLSDWRFLSGVILTFTGACGILLMVMRYAAEGISFAQMLQRIGLPAVILASLAGAGIVICIVSTVLCLRIPKNKKDKKKNEKS